MGKKKKEKKSFSITVEEPKKKKFNLMCLLFKNKYEILEKEILDFGFCLVA